MLLVSRPVVAEDDDIRRGVLWMLLTTFFFVSLDTTAKYLLQFYPVLEVVWARFFFNLIFVVILLAPRLRAHAASQRPLLQFLRSGLLLTTTILFFSGIHLLPLADASAIMFTSPILVTVLSIPLLGEHVGPRRFAAVAVGFIGALIVVRPGTGMMGIGAVLLLGSAFCNALYQLTTRRLRGVDGPLTTLLYTALMGAVLLSFAMPSLWVTPEPWHWLLFMLLGALGGVGHFSLIKAFQSAPAAVVAPFAYTSLLWATASGFVIFGDLPDRWTIIGAAIIGGGALYIMHRERVTKAESMKTDT